MNGTQKESAETALRTTRSAFCDFQLLPTEPPKGNPSKVLQVLKQKVSRALHGKKVPSGGQLELAFATEESRPSALWQRRFYDFNMWSEKKLVQKLDYMHRNPVDRELVQHPRDWPWSFYEKRGTDSN